MDTLAPRLNIVLVEDHDTLRYMLQLALEEAGHLVTALSCAEELEDQARGHQADVFLIDLGLPGEDGLSLVRRVRTAHPLAGVIVLTARSGLADKIESYERGADLYLGKPIEAAELCAAVSAMGRRRQRFTTFSQLNAEDHLVLDPSRLRISKPSLTPVDLSSSEVSMLTAFSRAPGQCLAYWQLAETLGLNLETYAKASLEVRVVRLRKKMIEAGADQGCIKAVRGHGYQLCVQIQVL